jgi:hypothetical protein
MENAVAAQIYYGIARAPIDERVGLAMNCAEPGLGNMSVAEWDAMIVEMRSFGYEPQTTYGPAINCFVMCSLLFVNRRDAFNRLLAKYPHVKAYEETKM